MILPPPGTVLGQLDAIPDPGGRVATWDDLPILLARKGDEIRAYLNVCPHAGRPLNLPDGRVIAHAGTHLICPAHGAVFDILTGQGDGPLVGTSGLKPIPVHVEDGAIKAGEI